MHIGMKTSWIVMTKLVRQSVRAHIPGPVVGRGRKQQGKPAFAQKLRRGTAP